MTQLIDVWMSLKRTTRTHVDGIQAQRNTCFNNHTLILFYFFPFCFLKKALSYWPKVMTLHSPVSELEK